MSRNESSSLRFAGFDTPEMAQRLTEIINQHKLLSLEMVRRFDDTTDFLRFADVNYTNPAWKIPMKFYRYAITQYVLDFPESAVHYSSLSVELMLFRSAIKKLGKDKLVELIKQNRSLSFKWLIEKSSLLAKDDQRIAHNIRKMRNCYVHFQNVLLFNEVGRTPDAQWLPGIPQEEVKKILAFDMQQRRSFEQIFPSVEELANKEAIDFIKSRRKIMNEKAFRLMRDAMKADNLQSYDPMETARRLQEEDILDCLKWSKQLLENPNYHVP